MKDPEVKDYILYYCLYKISRKGKTIETGSISEVPFKAQVERWD